MRFIKKISRVARAARLTKLVSTPLAFIVLSFSFHALAAERNVSVAELTRLADIVVLAEITGMTSKVVETQTGKFPFIYYQAKAKTLIAGPCPESFILRVPGLISAEKIITIPDAPELAPGTLAVLFIRRTEGAGQGGNEYELVGLSNAMFPVASETKDRVSTVFLPVFKPMGLAARSQVQVKLSDLILQVKAIRKNQALKEIKP